jgi:hypothetical protein
MRTALTLFALVLIPAVARTEDNRRPEKMTVADVLKALSLTDTKLDFVDEPPGKLQALECEATLRDTKTKTRIRIELVYSGELFSGTRTWDAKAVSGATVHHVVITPLATAK